MTKSSTIAPAFMVGTELSQSMLEIVTCLESMSKLNTTLVCFGTKKTVLNSTSLDFKVCFKFVSGGKWKGLWGRESKQCSRWG